MENKRLILILSLIACQVTSGSLAAMFESSLSFLTQEELAQLRLNEKEVKKEEQKRLEINGGLSPEQALKKCIEESKKLAQKKKKPVKKKEVKLEEKTEEEKNMMEIVDNTYKCFRSYILSENNVGSVSTGSSEMILLAHVLEHFVSKDTELSKWWKKFYKNNDHMLKFFTGDPKVYDLMDSTEIKHAIKRERNIPINSNCYSSIEEILRKDIYKKYNKLKKFKCIDSLVNRINKNYSVDYSFRSGIKDYLTIRATGLQFESAYSY